MVTGTAAGMDIIVSTVVSALKFEASISSFIEVIIDTSVGALVGANANVFALAMTAMEFSAPK